MIINKNLDDFRVNKNESIKFALEKINNNKRRLILVVNDDGVLVGLLSDGDIRRWLINQTRADLTLPIGSIMNKDFIFASITTAPARIESNFTEKINFIPLVDQSGKLVAVAMSNSDKVKIGDKYIGESVFIIAEIGNNHNGSVDLAKELINLAAEAGADCVKFQMRDLNALFNNQGKTKDAREDLGSQYVLDLLNKFNLTPDQLFELFDYAKQKKILPLCTPWDSKSLENLEKYGMPAYKIASADLTNDELLIAASKTGQPLLCSTGMAVEHEIRHAVDILKSRGSQFALLHCNSTYPAPFKDINLRYLSILKDIGGCPVGYSGHERGYAVPVAAVAFGAKIIEKHLTVDRTMEGNDHRASLLPGEFKEMVKCIREVELALGNCQKTILSQGEMINREILGKSLSINCDLPRGAIIQEAMISIKGPGKGLPPYRKNDVAGKVSMRDFKKGDFISSWDISATRDSLKQFNFSRPWGVPVRLHDFNQITESSDMNLVEFHLSYQDLEEDEKKYIPEKIYDIDFICHAPELFSGDHLLDLCSPDEEYRRKSVKNLQKAINVSRKLKKYFSKCSKPMIIVHVGGATFDRPLNADEKGQYYNLLKNSLDALDSEGVEILPETMPPLPWHFGGQRYHNIFIDPDEIIDFCKKNNFRVCLDVAHSKLACNYYGWSFQEFINKVGLFAAHYHIADAQGVDGEGLQINDGEIDFRKLADWMRENSPKASFIPEIWQGHKDGGAGFWEALRKIEGLF